MKKKILTVCITVILLLNALLVTASASINAADVVDYANYASMKWANNETVIKDNNGNSVEFYYDESTHMFNFNSVHFNQGYDYDENGDMYELPEYYLIVEGITLGDILPDAVENATYKLQWLGNTDITPCFANMQDELILEINYRPYMKDYPLTFKSWNWSNIESFEIGCFYASQNGEEIYINSPENYPIYKGTTISSSYNEGYVAGKETGYNQGYTAGNTDGTAAGYEQGVAAQMEKNRTGIFKNANFKAKLYYNLNDGKGRQIKEFSFEPNIIQDGVYFENLFDDINAWSQSTYDDNLYIFDYTDYVTIEISWMPNDVFDLLSHPIYIVGDPDVNYGSINDIYNHVYSVNADPGNEKRKFVPTVEFTSIVINKFSIQIGRPYDLLCSFTLYSENERYNIGYHDGYTAGVDDGEKKGYNEGSKNGFLLGKEEGLRLSENSNWRSLMTAVVETPVNAFQSLFNFEILGLDMRMAFGSILAICVLFIVIKFAIK